MKKILSVVVVFVMLVAMSASAFAVAPNTTQNEDGSWTTAGSDAAYANSMMTILAYTSGTTPSVDSIQYIDQTVASADGAYSFANYLPKVDPASGVEYVVKVGGQKIATPLDAGVIKGATVSNVTVTGKVVCTGTNTPATITLAPAEGDALEFKADAATGAFTIEAPKGTYTMTISKPAHTKYIYNGIDVEAIAGDYTIVAGNTNGDNVIDVTDISPIVVNLGGNVAEFAELNVNDDIAIDVTDISPIVVNLGATDTVLPVVAE